MKVAARRLLEEQLVVVAVLGSGKKSDAMWHVLQSNGAKLIVKHFNTSVAQHFYPIKIATIWNPLLNEVVSSRTVNCFKSSLTNTGQKISQMSELNGSNHRCRAQFKCAQTVVGQRFAGNGHTGLSYYYY